MKLKLLLALLCSLPWLNAVAETRYVSDNVYAYMHTGPSNKYRIMGSINAGEVVTFLTQNSDTNYVQIRDQDGRTGWIKADFIQTEESYKSRTPRLEQELTVLKQQLAGLDESHRQDVADKLNLIEQQQAELGTLRAQLDEVRRDNDQLAADNRRLASKVDDREHSMRMDWLLRGGLVAGAGALFGLLLPLLPLRRRRGRDRWMN
ncbi:TIGR04211 family SH3 domain-containing protein [Zobellella maritima]|uniref:TIGR04211 family SH3 domain-containing protein n=1 Tax=Zobellella maritima TaxID=2059725 RepID=UPI000E302CB6|nr:TIGR04211 family SH3 domain-containing protein [Zobellella maritima]